MIEDGDRVTLGGMTLRAFWTGGHTQGATMWMTTVQEGGNTYPSRSVEARFQTPELRSSTIPGTDGCGRHAADAAAAEGS